MYTFMCTQGQTHTGKQMHTHTLTACVYLLTGHNVTQKEIRNKYIRSATFYLDVLAVLPIEVFAPAFNDSYHYISVLKVNRFLKLWKVRMNVHTYQ